MKQKIITGLLLFAILFPALYVGGWPLRAVVIGFLTISAYEVVIATGTKLPVWLVVPILAMVFVLGAIDEAYLLPVIITVIISLFIILVLLEELTLNDMTYLFIMVLMMAFTLRSVAAIQDYGTRLVVYIASITYATDTCAYFAGHAFGKHKLNPRISPKKTIEGSIGGWVGGFLIGMLFGYIFIRNIPFDLILLSSFILPVIGQFGDLTFSAVKRHYGIKDFGSIFPAHGGVLDRIDSLIFNLMTFFVLMNFFI